MATKYVNIEPNELPYIQTDADGLFYAVRYRIISEDRNRFSHWSPTIRVDYPPTSSAGLPYTAANRIGLKEIGGGTGEKTLLITWTHPDLYASKLEEIFDQTTVFDIYIRWSTENNATDSSTWTSWNYFTTISADTFSIELPSSTYKTIDFEVQIPTLIKNRDNRLTLFKLRHAV